MAATFPGGVKVFTTKQAGDQIASAHINDLQAEVVAVETELKKTTGSVVDHGGLAGLNDNDHPQYLLTTGKAADSDKLDGIDSTGFATAEHNHDAAYLGISAKAADSDKLDGNDSTYFMPQSYKDGWIPVSDTWSYVSTTSFKVSGKDVRYKFPKGTKIKLVQSDSTKYFYVVETAFSTDTTVTITGGSDYALANENISGQAYSYAENPQNYPFSTVAIRVERSTNQSIPNDTWTALSFDAIITEEKPATTSQWSSGSPTRLICRLPGYYLVNAHVRFAADATGVRGFNLMKNGVAVTATIIAAFSERDPHFQCSAIVKLDTGDYVESLCYQNSGAALDVVSTSHNLCLEWIRLGI